MDKILENLNIEQLSAVKLPPESALILAGAGSGKTRVLTTRIAWLVRTGQVSMSGIMAVTFTNKAAKEMLSRISALLNVDTRTLWVGTFHGLCNRILRLHWQDAGLPQSFSILDSQDQLSAVRRLLKANQIDTDRFPPRNLVNFISRAKEQGLRPSDMKGRDTQENSMIELYAKYEDQCRQDGTVDFSELLLRCYELLSRNQPLREHYQARFAHILVDEFQDTNDLQYKWLKLLAGKDGCMFAVGDDDQSIYAFRGANVGNMHAFLKDFSVRHMIRLEQNYRSKGNILNAANKLISHNKDRLGKTLFTAESEGDPVRIRDLPSDLEEARWIIEEVKELEKSGIKRSEIALLYRSNAQSRVIEQALFSEGIPYRVYGGMRFFDRAEIKHAVAYLQLVENPHNNSAFLRVANFPARGIGARSLELLQETAQNNSRSFYDTVPLLKGKSGAALSAFTQLIDSIRQEVKTLPLPELIETVIKKSGLILHYETEKEGKERIENLGQISSGAAIFLGEEGFAPDAPAMMTEEQAKENPAVGTQLPPPDPVFGNDLPMPLIMSPLSAFLSYASLESGESQASSGDDALQLMTVHAAKGLEFDAVFITGLEEGLFPHENSARDPGGLQEERRLMYVAITRARKRLYMSYAQTRMLHGHMNYNLQSSFLDELPEEGVKWLSPRNKRSRFDRDDDWAASGFGGGSDFREKPRVPASGYPSGGSRRSGNSYYGTSGRIQGGYSQGTGYSSRSGGQSMQKSAPSSFGRGTEWKIGESVRHKKFGEGVILALEGDASSLRAQIRFENFGTRLLDLTIAKLEHVS